MAARPGATIFGPPGESGEQVRLDEAGQDLDVVVQEVGVDPDRAARAGLTEVAVPPEVERVVVDHPVAPRDLRAEHPLQLLRGVAAMGAGGDEDGDVGRVNVVDLGEDDGQDAAGRGGAGHVADDDGDAGSRRYPLAQRLGAVRLAHRLTQRGGLVRQPGQVASAR